MSAGWLPRPRLPFRLWRQAAHLVVPATSAELVRKAIERGTQPTTRLLERAALTPDDVARSIADPGAPEAAVAGLLARPEPAPVVVVDGEDALAWAATDAAWDVLVEALGDRPAHGDGGRGVAPAAGRPLVLFRTPPLDDDAERLAGALERLARAAGGEPSLDGVILPKVGSAAEVRRLAAVLARAERSSGLAAGRLRILLMIESAAGVTAAADLARRPDPRLAGLVFGLVDYAADAGLPAIDPAHPVALRARAAVIEAAALAGVPAIDGMTLAYPAAGSGTDAGGARRRVIDGIVATFRDALAAFELGFAGKWVGHPAQLFATLLARTAAFRPERLEAAVAHLEAYAAAAAAGTGVVLVDGSMADRATARHAGELLRRAAAAGAFPAERAAALGIIEPAELVPATTKREAGP